MSRPYLKVLRPSGVFTNDCIQTLTRALITGRKTKLLLCLSPEGDYLLIETRVDMLILWIVEGKSNSVVVRLECV